MKETDKVWKKDKKERKGRQRERWKERARILHERESMRKESKNERGKKRQT